MLATGAGMPGWQLIWDVNKRTRALSAAASCWLGNTLCVLLSWNPVQGTPWATER